MERLSDDELIIIAQEIPQCGTRHLMSFMRISKTHTRISKMHSVLGRLPPDYVNLFNRKNITCQQHAFLNMMMENGHAHYCVMYGVSLLYKLEPYIVEIRCVSKISSDTNAEAADYFLMLLDASAETSEKIEEALSTFTSFLKRRSYVNFGCAFICGGFLFGCVLLLSSGIDQCQRVWSLGYYVLQKIHVNETGDFLVLICLLQGNMMNILKRTSAFSTGLTRSFTDSEGCSILVLCLLDHDSSF